MLILWKVQTIPNFSVKFFRTCLLSCNVYNLLWSWSKTFKSLKPKSRYHICGILFHLLKLLSPSIYKKLLYQIVLQIWQDKSSNSHIQNKSNVLLFIIDANLLKELVILAVRFNLDCFNNYCNDTQKHGWHFEQLNNGTVWHSILVESKDICYLRS